MRVSEKFWKLFAELNTALMVLRCYLLLPPRATTWGVFSSRKVREKVAVTHFNFIWQLLFNYGVISLKNLSRHLKPNYAISYIF